MNNTMSFAMPNDLGVPDGAQPILDYISSGEAQDYNELYGGGQFSGYDDHPRQRFALGNGLHTDAAGKYQFLSSTWDQEASKLGLKDFAPGSQDTAAWDLANSTYKKKTGKDLLGDWQNGHVDWGALSSTWPSLARGGAKPQGSSAGSSSGDSAAEVANQTDASGGPDRLGMMSLLQQLMPQHKFTPVDYDPFAVQPKGDAQ